MNDRKVWAAFLLLALTWGSSFLFIKIAVQTLQPFTLVALRLGVGLAGLLVLMRLRGLSLPRGRTIWQHLSVMGLFNVAVPFVLITWAESGANGVDSSVASVLNSTVPLFSIVISGVILSAETVTAGKVIGLLVGFAGVVLLLSRHISQEWAGFVPYLAVVIASLCYAAASAYGRRHLQGLPVLVISTGQLITATTIVALAMLFTEDLSQQSLPLPTIASILWLGLLGSCLAYILYFTVLQNWGATRTTLVTYLLPVVGVAAGVIFLNEALDWRLLAGGLLILSGVGVVLRPRPDRFPHRSLLTAHCSLFTAHSPKKRMLPRQRRQPQADRPSIRHLIS
jgi:drug/metabolite transporter (DMT)-like permease